MGNPTYVFNPSDGLYHPVIVTGSGDDMSLAVSQDGGVLTPPAYIAVEGESLITLETYLIANKLTALTGMTQEEWGFFAVGISDLVELYCSYSWRTLAVAVPVGLQKVVARMIKTDIEQATKQALNFKSESITNYSYTLQDGANSNDVLSNFKNSLAPFRVCFVGM